MFEAHTQLVQRVSNMVLAIKSSISIRAHADFQCH